MVVVVDSSPETLCALGAIRTVEREPFDEDDRRVLDLLVPHLKRATRLQVQLTMMSTGRRAASDVLDHFPMGMVVADEHGRVQFTNKAAEELAGDGFIIRGNYVSAERPEERAQMLLAIDEAVQTSKNGGLAPAEAMTITRGSGGPPLTLMISTLWGKHIQYGRGLLDNPHAILFISDPSREPWTPAESLRHLFGLSPKEAQLVEALVSNRTLEEAAENVGVTKETARTYLRAVFKKTDTRRQADLVSLVRSTPAWLHAPNAIGIDKLKLTSLS